MYNDSLFRVSFKCLIFNDENEVFVIKERGRSSWDLPGGGMDHGESIEESIARELREETAYEGDFTYSIVTIDNPIKLLTRDVWQLKVIVRIEPETMDFTVGEEAEEAMYIDPVALKNSEHESERRVYEYIQVYNHS